ncbi:hypothetical protein F4779DRAFT_608954 [Xylariaceae sp. FL0662B]|nr:hypothetical protein F4779DRAFT_608954 [Xylariaceae sp. FL0662B]
MQEQQKLAGNNLRQFRQNHTNVRAYTQPPLAFQKQNVSVPHEHRQEEPDATIDDTSTFRLDAMDPRLPEAGGSAALGNLQGAHHQDPYGLSSWGLPAGPFHQPIIINSPQMINGNNSRGNQGGRGGWGRQRATGNRRGNSRGGGTNSGQSRRETRKTTRARNHNLARAGGMQSPPSPCRYCGGNHWNNHCAQRPRPPLSPSPTPVSSVRGGVTARGNASSVGADRGSQSRDGAQRRGSAQQRPRNQEENQVGGDGGQEEENDGILNNILASFRGFCCDAGLPRSMADVLTIHSGLLRAWLAGTLEARRRRQWNELVREATALRWQMPDGPIWTQLFL